MYAVIMAGGAGTRFWPMSRKNRPKQFLDITGRGPMIVEACDRLSLLCTDGDMAIILGREHLAEARTLFANRSIRLVAEPVGRNTAPCMGLGAICARRAGCRDAVAFLPADHYIADPKSFLGGLSAAGALAKSGGIVTLGIVPNRPETGYGYIRRDATPIPIDHQTAYGALAFVEKPDLETAVSYLQSRDYLWNAGIFVATADTILNEIRQWLPKWYDGLMRLEQVWDTPKFEEALADVYAGLEGISFDYGVMEKTWENVYVLPCECGWSDVGSWFSFYELRAESHDRNQNATEGEVVLIDCEKNLVASHGGRLVACLGLHNVLVVDTPDALMVTDLDRSQDIRKIVTHLKQTGKEDLL